MAEDSSTARQFRVRSLMLLPIALLPIFLSLYSIHHYIAGRGLGLSRQYGNVSATLYVLVFLWIWNRRVPPSGNVVWWSCERGALIGGIFGVLYNAPRGIVVAVGTMLRIHHQNGSGYVSPLAMLQQALVFVISAVFIFVVGAMTGTLYGCVLKVIKTATTRRTSD